MKKVFLYQILVFTIHGKHKKSQNKNKFKISASIWSNDFELSDAPYSTSHIQDYTEYI